MQDYSYRTVNFSLVIFLFKSFYSPELSFDPPRHLRARVWKLLHKFLRKETRCFSTAGLAEHVLCSSIFQVVADLPQHCHSYTAQHWFWRNCHISSKMLHDKTYRTTSQRREFSVWFNTGLHPFLAHFAIPHASNWNIQTSRSDQCSI